MVQINAPEYDFDIDGQTELLPDIQPSVSSHTAHTEEVSLHAENIKEDTAPVTANSREHPALLHDSDMLESQSQPVLDSAEHSVHQDTKRHKGEYPKQLQTQIRRCSRISRR